MGTRHGNWLGGIILLKVNGSVKPYGKIFDSWGSKGQMLIATARDFFIDRANQDEPHAIVWQWKNRSRVTLSAWQVFSTRSTGKLRRLFAFHWIRDYSIVNRKKRERKVETRAPLSFKMATVYSHWLLVDLNSANERRSNISYVNQRYIWWQFVLFLHLSFFDWTQRRRQIPGNELRGFKKVETCQLIFSLERYANNVLFMLTFNTFYVI